MAGKRMIHSNICESKKLSTVSYAAETLYYRLLSRADDDGNFTAEPRLILGQCMPYREDQDAVSVEELLQELTTITNGDKQPLISFYLASGDRYLHINRFQDFQYLRPDRTAVAVYPTHPKEVEQSTLAKRKEDGLPTVYHGHTTDIPFSEVVGSNQINTKSISNQINSSHDSGDFKNLAVKYRRVFETRLGGSKAIRQRYAEACRQYSEPVVLEMFDAWAPTAMWIHDLAKDGKLHTDGLKGFYENLQELIELELTAKKDEEIAQKSQIDQEASIVASVEAGRAESLERLTQIRKDLEEQDEANQRIANDPSSFFGTSEG